MSYFVVVIIIIVIVLVPSVVEDSGGAPKNAPETRVGMAGGSGLRRQEQNPHVLL